MGRPIIFTLFCLLLDASLRATLSWLLVLLKGLHQVRTTFLSSSTFLPFLIIMEPFQGVTGGGSATAQTPTSISQLATWLSDSTARVIVLDKIFDFTTSEGTTTGSVCIPWTCSPNPQQAVADSTWCDPYAKTTGTWNVAGKTALRVGPNKVCYFRYTSQWIKLIHHAARPRWIKELGLECGLSFKNCCTIASLCAPHSRKGKGLTINGSKNVMIQNNQITDINERYVWGGDGMVLSPKK